MEGEGRTARIAGQASRVPAVDRRTVLAMGGALAMAGIAGGFEAGAQEPPVEATGPRPANNLRAALARHTDSGYVPGVVAAVWRDGELQVEVLGRQAFDGAPMQRNSIFRIASISKPLTAAAAMILVEEGRLGLDDPVDELLPELKGRRVLRSIDAELDDTVPAERSITLRDLLTLRFGLGAIMAYPPKYPIQQAMAAAEVAPSEKLFAHPPDVFMQRLGALPLAAQPGESWLYHTGIDVAGVLIARASGQALGEFMRIRVFAPLGMSDTGFYVPENKIERLVTAYRSNPDTGELVVFDGPRGLFSRPPVFEAGGGGCVSTADDYLKFCRMLLGNGELDGVRILSPASVEEMTRDQLTAAQKDGPNASLFFNGHSGWGLGMAVALRQDEPWLTPGRFGWDGGYGTSAYTDPREKLIGVLMTQRLMNSPQPPPTYTDFWTAAYQPAGE